MSRDGIRRFVPYKPNSQVQAFFSELKKRQVAAPVNETVHVSSKPVKHSEERVEYKKTSKKKSAPRRATKLKQNTSPIKKARKKKSKSKKGVDKKLRGVKL